MGHGFHGYVSHNQRVISDNLLLKWAQPNWVLLIPCHVMKLYVPGHAKLTPQKQRHHRDPV